jgi:hypothetical protein
MASAHELGIDRAAEGAAGIVAAPNFLFPQFENNSVSGSPRPMCTAAQNRVHR